MIEKEVPLSHIRSLQLETPMNTLPSDLKKLIEHLKKLPGVGARTAERFAFRMLTWEDDQIQDLCHTLSHIKTKLPPCEECGCLTEQSSCLFCHNPRRDSTRICVVAHYKDVCNIETTQSFSGLYHVLGALISPILGINSDKLKLHLFKERVIKYRIEEIILALDSTIEGDTTSLVIKDMLKDVPVKVTRLAFGMPMGSPIEYVDGSTLTRALSGRHNF